MKFTCWRPESGEFEEDGRVFEGLDGARDAAGRARSAAVKFAEDYHANRGGWEATWPITVCMRDEDRVFYVVEVSREMVPEFWGGDVRITRGELAVWEGDCDTVIAYDREDVYQILLEHGSLSRDEFNVDSWTVVDPNKVITIQNFRGDDKPVTMTAAEFIKSQGRCFLCSTEF